MSSSLAYKHYRIYITRNADITYRFTSIKRVELFSDLSINADNIAKATMATANASGSYKPETAPINALEGGGTNANGWESSSISGGAWWFMVSFNTPKEVQAFNITFNTQEKELPTDFILQVSNDGDVWEDIYVVTDNVSRNFSVAPYLRLSGLSKLDNGARSSRVCVYDWNTAQLKGVVVPDIDGNWRFPLRYDDDVFVTHIGTAGYEPKTDGPIKPYSIKT